MKKALSGAFSVLVPYLIFISNLGTSVKSLLVSLLCGIILIFFVIKAGGWKRISRRRRALSAPTLVLILTTVLNVIFDLQISVLALWMGYFSLTALSFIVSEALAPR